MKNLLQNNVNKCEVFVYNDTPITFELDNGDVMINATQMAKPFGKLVSNFTKTEQTQAFIQTLCNQYSLKNSDVIQVVNGGNSPGTWMNRKLALKFASWLNPEFELWVYDRIEEILTTGSSGVNEDAIIGKALQILQKRNDALAAENARLLPRSQFVEKVFEADDLISMSQAAKLLNLPLGRNKLLKNLREKGVLFKSSNEPKQDLVNKGYFSVKECLIETGSGKAMIKMQTLVTQKGLGYLAKLYGVVDVPKPTKAVFVP